MAINQTQVKNNVYKAIEVIAEQRIDSLKLDKTIIGTVESKISNGNNQYRIKYNGGTLYAYAQDDSVYLPNTTVYVLVPENDFNNKKWIVGRVSNTKVDQNIDVVGHALNEYSVIGTNTVYVADEELADAFKLKSYSTRQTGETYQDANVLYDAKQPEISVLGINVGDLETYVRQAQAISFAADFRTSLTKEQQRNVSGDYGLIFNVRFKNKNTSYPTMQDKWDALEPNTRTKIDMIPEPEYKGLSYYEQEIRDIITNQTQTTQEMQQAVDNVNQLMIDFIAKTAATLDSDTQSLVNQYAQLIDDILALTVNNAGEPITPGDILAEYLGWFNGESDSYVEVVESYFLDVNNMVGNPYNLKEYAHQYITVPIEAERFVGIDTIYFYCDGFIQNDTKARQWGYDLFVKDIEINCLEELDDINNEYRLTLDFPQGAIFRTNESADTRLVRAHIVYQNREDLTPFCTFSWFKQNSAVTPQSSKYNAMAGSGWERVSIDSITTEVEFAAVDNKAYENHYKVIGTYNLETILIKQFILYNEANKHDVELVCDSGFAFEFSDSTKTIICEIDGESQPEAYEYVWSVDGEPLTITADRYREIIAELQSRDPLTVEILQQISVYKNQLNKIEGLIWNNNTLQFPSSKMPANGEVHIWCGVRKDGYDIGAAEATLSQGNVITLKGYYIEIENGNQTFQYNEAGVSPASERYNEPIEVLPLHCKFYSPSGNLINSLNYTVKWKVPLENTLIIVDRTKIDEEGINPYAVCNFAISDDYNYSSLNNQILCIVEFNGDVYTETTDFYFGKIGENGTNGTDVVAKIVPIGEKTNSVLNNELLALNVYPDGTSRWNTGAAIDTAVLELQLFRRNVYIDPNDPQDGYKLIKWSMSGDARSYREMSVSPSLEGNIYGVVSYDPAASGRNRFRVQIVKGQASLRKNDDYQAYNYFYPIPTVLWEQGITPFSLGIDKTYTLRQILYNADGRNPAYNKNQGIKLNLPEGYYFTCTAVGGIDESTETAAFSMGEVDENNFASVEPNDIYTGEYVNNCIEAKVYNENNELQCTIYVPIHMSLNTYGLASLNDWDGNSIEIDEDAGHILAPQIGAGEKNPTTNQFTGIIMGTEKTYEDQEGQVGLLGYSEGRQSIFLNAKDGSATFGLPEDQSSKSDPRTEGRIRLIPGGESNIGNWVIGQNFLYNAHYEDSLRTLVKELNNGYKDGWIDEEGAPHTKDIGHTFDLPQEANGVLLAADPSYISVKSRAITDKDLEGATDNVVIEPGDFLEAQVDPNQFSVFSIMRHHLYKQNQNDSGTWIRSKIAYIDAAGRFVSGAMHHGDSSLGVGYVGGLGYSAGDEKYVGLNLETTNKEGTVFYPILKAFISSTLSNDSTLYLSGGNTNITKPDRTPGENTGDYQRPIQIMGKELNLKTNYSNDNSRINLTTSTAFLGHKNASLYLNSSDDTSKLYTLKKFTREIEGANLETLKGGSTINITGAFTQTITGNASITTANSEIRDSSNQFRIYGKTQSTDKGTFTPYDLVLSRDGSATSQWKATNHRIVLQTSGTGVENTEGPNINYRGTIGIHALNTPWGISIATSIGGGGDIYNDAGLRLVGATSDQRGSFNLYAGGGGQVWTGAGGYNFTKYGTQTVFVHDTINTHGIFVDEGAQFYTMAQSNIVGGKKGDYQYSSNRNNLWNLIYDCLTAAADARNAAKAAHNRADAAYSRAGDALSDAEDAWDKAVSAYNLANSKANASHTHTTVGGWGVPFVESMVVIDGKVASFETNNLGNFSTGD